MLLGASTVQVCTAVMHYGFRIVEDMIDGLSNWMDEKGFANLDDVARPVACRRVSDWGDLDLNYKVVAKIDPREVHRLPPLLRRLRGRRAPVDRARARASRCPR